MNSDKNWCSINYFDLMKVQLWKQAEHFGIDSTYLIFIK